NPASAGPGATAPGGSFWARLDWRIVGVLAVGVVSIPIWRATTTHARPSSASEASVAAAVARVTRSGISRELVCQAELRPYQEVDLHAKVAGFLKSISVDIGDKVEASQLIAIIEVPELSDEIERARAALKRSQEEVARAQAAAEAANLVYT